MSIADKELEITELMLGNAGEFRFTTQCPECGEAFPVTTEQDAPIMKTVIECPICESDLVIFYKYYVGVEQSRVRKVGLCSGTTKSEVKNGDTDPQEDNSKPVSEW